MLSNPMIIDWVQRTLVRAGAAERCAQHGHLKSTANDAAARSAVIVGQLARFDDLSQNAIELVILETYLALPTECVGCDGASQLTYVSPAQRIPKS